MLHLHSVIILPFLPSRSEASHVYWAKEGKTNVTHLKPNREYVVDKATLEDAGM